MRGTAREIARVMETARTRSEKAKRTAGFCGLPLGFRVRFGKWDATLEVGGCSCTVEEGRSGTRLVPRSSMDWGAATAGHCGVLTVDQGVPAEWMRPLQGALFACLRWLGAVRVVLTERKHICSCLGV